MEYMDQENRDKAEEVRAKEQIQNAGDRKDKAEGENSSREENGDQGEGGAAGASPEEVLLVLQAELDKAKEQAADYYGHLQRLQAEFDNYRKRTLKEKEELVKYASEQVVEALLPVLDNFERALESAKNKQDFASFAQGVEMIFRQMQNILAKEGLAPIDAVGRPFDPNVHEAVMQVDSEEYPENTVVAEVQKGYYLKDKVLRPSMVQVSR